MMPLLADDGGISWQEQEFDFAGGDDYGNEIDVDAYAVEDSLLPSSGEEVLFPS